MMQPSFHNHKSSITVTNQTETQLAIKRAEYIKKLRITVKPSKKTQDQQQLILIQTYNLDRKQSVELIVRKLSQVDCFIQIMNNNNGGHIIPSLTTDFFYQHNLLLEQVVKAIQQYLQELQHNKYCLQDIKFYCFVLEQDMRFPQTLAYDKILNSATDFSRKYISSLFTRKTIPQLQSTGQYLISYKYFTDFINNRYQPIKQITLVKIKQILQLEDIMMMFADINPQQMVLAIQPQQVQIQAAWKMILTSDKLIKQGQAAHVRWQILIEITRQLQNNICKGLHQDMKLCQRKIKQVKIWSQSLTLQFQQLCQYIDSKIQRIIRIIKRIYQPIIQQNALPDLITQQQNGKKQELAYQSNRNKMRKLSELRESLSMEIDRYSKNAEKKKQQLEKLIIQNNRKKSTDIFSVITNLYNNQENDETRGKQETAVLMLDQSHKKEQKIKEDS